MFEIFGKVDVGLKEAIPSTSSYTAKKSKRRIPTRVPDSS
jgi:hypothetical protein